MATADELLMAAAGSEEEILIVDLDTRVISIPATLKVLGVESDDDVKRLQFKILRHYGEFDLSRFNIRINYENARGQGDFYPVDDLTIDGDLLSFSWLVDRVAFAHAGDVKFSICMKLFDDSGVVVKELNTTYTTLPVLKGLETEQALVEQNPSAFDNILFRLYAVEAATGNGRDGYYSVVKVDQTEDGMTLTIVNQDGETTAIVRNGIDGQTPQKGVDYFTETEVNEIEQEVIERVSDDISKITPKYLTVVLHKGSDNWSNGRQTVTASGVSSKHVVYVSPLPDEANYEVYTSNAIKCVSKGTNTLTFTCESVPDADVSVNVAVYPKTT